MAVKRLVDYLEHTNTYYTTIRHEAAYTALSSAKAAHVSGRKMVKSVLLKLDESYALAVLPSDKKVDFHRIKELTGSQTAVLADEEDIEEIFPDCSPGAIPPLGNLYHMPVITDKEILDSQSLFFEPGSHREVMKIHLHDFLRLAHPRIAVIHRIF